MAGRGPTTFQKRQKEQQRKEKRLNKLARREERRQAGPESESENEFDENALNPVGAAGEHEDAAADMESAGSNE